MAQPKAFICENAVVTGDVEVGVNSVAFPCVSIEATVDCAVKIGERNVLDERSSVKDSSIEHSNTLSSGCSVIGSTLGSFNTVGPRAVVKGCRIGNLCCIGAGCVLENAVIADNTSVFLLPCSSVQVQGDDEEEEGGAKSSSKNWASVVLASEQLKQKFDECEAYRRAIIDPSSSTFVAKHFALR